MPLVFTKILFEQLPGGTVKVIAYGDNEDGTSDDTPTEREYCCSAGAYSAVAEALFKTGITIGPCVSPPPRTKTGDPIQ